MGSKTICKYFHMCNVNRWDTVRNMFLPVVRCECWGTKERDVVSCAGCADKCHTGGYRAEDDVLNTASMWIAAQKDGKRYINTRDGMLYSKEKGFHNKDGHKQEDIMNDIWKEYKVMSKAEAEQALGVVIED